MFVQFILFSSLLSFCLMIKNNSYGICQKRNLCRKKNEPCNPVVMKCQNGSCRYRRYNTSNCVKSDFYEYCNCVGCIGDNQSVMFSRWFYDTNYQRCRRYNNHIENFVYFRYLRDCRRLCPIIREKKTDRIITLQVFDTPSNYNDTLYVNLHVDLSPNWIQRLVDWMNISTRTYHSQMHYFQNYRRRFANFIDPTYQLMHDHQQNMKKKDY